MSLFRWNLSFKAVLSCLISEKIYLGGLTKKADKSIITLDFWKNFQNSIILKLYYHKNNTENNFVITKKTIA